MLVCIIACQGDFRAAVFFSGSVVAALRHNVAVISIETRLNLMQCACYAPKRLLTVFAAKRKVLFSTVFCRLVVWPMYEKAKTLFCILFSVAFYLPGLYISSVYFGRKFCRTVIFFKLLLRCLAWVPLSSGGSSLQVFCDETSAIPILKYRLFCR